MAVLMQMPLDDVEGGAVVLVEADRADISGGLTLASPDPGQAAAVATRSLSASLAQLEPVLRTVKDKLAASAPEHFTVEFGVKLGGEYGVILAKGTAEVNLKITMTWDRKQESDGGAGDGV
jgi:Trypsin-co-occurring domain 1